MQRPGRLAAVRVLVIGSGGREHALVRALAADGDVTGLDAAPGNPGIAEIADIHEVTPADPASVTALAARTAADLVVIGPEAPLVAGVADAVREAGVACFGPGRQAAMIEGSKSFAKQVMSAAGIPTAAARTCTTDAEVSEALDAFGPPYVVKADGLAAGKGVVVTRDRGEAAAHASACGTVVIEEFLDGPEVSVFALADGERAVPLLPAQDYKRARVPAVAELRRRGTPYSGLLYAGLSLTEAGIKVVEFNARFGDPETQVVLDRLDTPLGGLLHAAATGGLGGAPRLRWRPGAAVTVVLAAEGYPGTPTTGDHIEGADAPERDADAYILHAGTSVAADGRIVSSGGRVLNIVGTGQDLAAARSAAYRAAGKISMHGGWYRSDIAERPATVPAPTGP
jgi:phosphoribosylamine---glycine ligase